MVSKGKFVGLDWNRITRLHSQAMTGTHELNNRDSDFFSRDGVSEFMCASHYLAV